ARIGTLARTSTTRFDLTIANGRWFYQRLTPPQPQPELIVRDGLAGTERVLYDPVASAGRKTPAAIEAVFVAPDGAKVAFTTQEGGAEEETLHVVDVASGKMLTDTLAHAGGGTSPSALAWDPGDGGFLYTRWPNNVAPSEAHFNIAIYHHTLGSDPASDGYVFGRGLWRSAEYNLITSSDSSQVAAFVEPGDGLNYAVYLRSGAGEFKKIANESTGIKDGAFIGHRLLLRTSVHSSRYEVVAVDSGKTFAEGTVVVPASDVVIDAVLSAGGNIITKDISGGESSVRAFKGDGSPFPHIALPEHLSVNGLAGDEKSSEVIVSYASYDTPTRWVQLQGGTASYVVHPTVIETKTPGDYSRVIVSRVFVPSLDGRVKIPLSIVSLPNIRRDGSAPTVMTAYGSYGIISEPRFLGTWLNWLEHGGVWAQANIRGGGEYGEEWHRAAWHENVTKRADDVAACAMWLSAHGYGNRRHLGILGGSAGGYLMGMALTRNPTLYRAVNSSVGIYDALRTELSPNGYFNIPEFGTVKDSAQFRWMYKASPYHHVQHGVAYPAVLMQTGSNDPRVEPMQSRKMVARLQADSTSGYPSLLIQKSGQGHGIGSSFGQRVAGQIETQVFFVSQLGELR
ncbi:MAG: prolyl oligopeptidase family serine peptidase, partial [Candidatus Eremiobacteraeota bacterium]|nr:prolyl oligopeptidase family serine peptidase [Candidatus Eremiobacteraeota bacterium]